MLKNPVVKTKSSRLASHLHAHISKGVHKLHVLIKASKEESSVELGEQFRSSPHGWLMSVGDMEAFWGRCSQLTAELMTGFFQEVIAHLEAMTAEVCRCTPKYEAFLNSKQYHKAMAKKQLLDWPDRQELPSMLVALYTFSTHVTNLRKEWLALGADVPCVETVTKRVVDALLDAKKAIATTAGAEAVQALKGQEQIDKAKQVLSKEELLPRALVEALQKVVSRDADKGKGKGVKRKAPGAP